jgi:urocanate hydratase
MVVSTFSNSDCMGFKLLLRFSRFAASRLRRSFALSCGPFFWGALGEEEDLLGAWKEVALSSSSTLSR